MDIARWSQIARLASAYETPLFLIWGEPFSLKHSDLQQRARAAGHVRQWYSFKTQPVPHVAAFARTLGMGIEVVSKFELATACTLGFPPSEILVNGVGKHTWLRRDIVGLNVIFDSIRELTELAPVASQLNWKCGLRVAVSRQVNADAPGQPPQFGIAPGEVGHARDLLAHEGLPVEILHFHLRSSVPAAGEYREALQELSRTAAIHDISPRVVDIGGGLPDWTLDATAALSADAQLEEYVKALDSCRVYFRDASEVWLENGRHLLGPSAILIVTVLDIKNMDGVQILICDGGRTNQALPSDWEQHNVVLLDRRTAHRTVDTIACGPTCMAYDFFYRGPFPDSVKVGDRLIYFNAGAYHISWENRFSTGLCNVVWSGDGRTLTLIRPSEKASEWSSSWKAVTSV